MRTILILALAQERVNRLRITAPDSSRPGCHGLGGVRRDLTPAKHRVSAEGDEASGRAAERAGGRGACVIWASTSSGRRLGAVIDQPAVRDAIASRPEQLARTPPDPRDGGRR